MSNASWGDVDTKALFLACLAIVVIRGGLEDIPLNELSAETINSAKEKMENLVHSFRQEAIKNHG